MGEKLFAVPWEALKLDTTNKRFELDVKKSGWRVPPASTRTSGPTWPTGFGKRVYAYYGTKPYSEPPRV